MLFEIFFFKKHLCLWGFFQHGFCREELLSGASERGWAYASSVKKHWLIRRLVYRITVRHAALRCPAVHRLFIFFQTLLYINLYYHQVLVAQLNNTEQNSNIFVDVSEIYIREFAHSNRWYQSDRLPKCRFGASQIRNHCL